MLNSLLRYTYPIGYMLTEKILVKDSPLHSKNDLDGLRYGFQEEYIDPYDLVADTVKEIKENITEYCENPAEYVAPYTSLITSSMMGKSRLTKEIARSIPSVYICLREAWSSGYPARTPILPGWIEEGVLAKVVGYETTPDIHFIIPTLKFSLFFLALNRKLSTLVLRNHKVGTTNPYLWMWQFFAEPESSEDLERRQSFWDNVVQEAESDMQTHACATRNTNLVDVAYLYLRANFGRDVCEAYENLKRAFGIFNDKDFTLLLICDEARILCDISAIDGKIIPTDLDPEEIRSPTETHYPQFSNFQAFRRALRYLMLAKSRAEPGTHHPNQNDSKGPRPTQR